MQQYEALIDMRLPCSPADLHVYKYNLLLGKHIPALPVRVRT